jgi:hypothetical protein
MRSILYDDAPTKTPEVSNPLATSLATLEPEKLNFNRLTRTLVGRPGLDLGTLGVGLGHPSASVDVRITWSEHSMVPPTSTEILSNLSRWLHHWLRGLGNVVIGDVKIRRADGLEIHVRFESSEVDSSVKGTTDPH